MRAVRDIRRAATWVLGIALATVATSGLALNLVELDRALGGKGYGNGGFSTQIHLGFDQQGNVVVSDAATRIIQKLDPNGAVLAQYPSADAESLDVVLSAPGDVAVDASGGIYVADTTVSAVEQPAGKTPVYLYTPCVHKFGPDLKFRSTVKLDVLQSLPSAPVTPVKEIIDASGNYALAIQPVGHDRKIQIAVDAAGNLFVLDAERASRQNVIKFSPDGKRAATFGRYGSGDGEFDSPDDMAVGADGNVFVADTGNDRIVQFDNGGAFVRAFASQGLGSNEVTSPAYIAATLDNRLLVRDASTFVRKELRSVPLETLSLSAFTSGQRALRPNLITDPLASQLTAEEELGLRLRRLEELRLLDEQEKNEQKELEDSALKTAIRVQNTLYHTVMQRVLSFDLAGNYIDTATYRMDQLGESRRDLVFVAADPLGNLYLQDPETYELLRYRVVGFSIRPADFDIVSSSRFMNQSTNDLQDYEDIDEAPDSIDDIDLLTAREKVLLNYDLSERWNVLVENRTSYSNRQGTNEFPEKAEDSLEFTDRSFDNDLYVGLKRVLNPNPYRYREALVYVQRQDGTSKLDSDGLFPELNLQKGRQDGTSGSTLLGLDLDLLRNANLQLQYYSYSPSDTSRNYTRSFWDLQGNLYQVLRTKNTSKVLTGELNLKF
ncbi:hypothetical protein FJZ36_02785 [Candidatus Poribacteria bacterium]|nr:hypothetical protein [Candidatus Poribacteria bacterium]